MIVFLFILLIFFGVAVWLYNALVKKSFLMDEAWSGIDVQLKRRHELIPNLVETVRGYSKHEEETLREVVELRNRAIVTNSVNEKGEIESSIARDLKTIFALAESYPKLKANKNFLQLQTALVDIEDDLQSARRYFNGTVRDLNILVQQFPSNIIANVFGYSLKEFFEVDYATERSVPEIQF